LPRRRITPLPMLGQFLGPGFGAEASSSETSASPAKEKVKGAETMSGAGPVAGAGSMTGAETVAVIAAVRSLRADGIDRPMGVSLHRRISSF
jgi:hypothetical protein